MSVLTDYHLGVKTVFNSKATDSSLSSYNYICTALAQSYRVYAATKIVTKVLQAYNRPIGAFPWYVRMLAVTAVPFSVCFEINRWSSDYQPHFWIKKTVHWVCDHTGQFMYVTCIVSSVVLAIIGKPGILIGIAVTFSIDQIQNYHILPAYYCRVLKTTNTLASIFFSKEVLSCWVSVTELAGNLYFSQSIQKNSLTDEITTTNTEGKTIADVKNNPSHIHFKPELKEIKVGDLKAIFDKITWYSTQMRDLLSKDNYWIKRADTSTDPISYVKSLRKHIEDALSDSKRLPLIELYLKIIIQYLHSCPKKYLENKELILDVVAQLRKNGQEGVDHLGGIAEECYEKIESFPLKDQVLQLLYKKRKELFNQLFDEFCEETPFGFFKEGSRLWARNAFDSHMGINFFLTDRTESLVKVMIYTMCKTEEINTEEYFCDQEESLYTSKSIIDLLMDQLGTTLSWDNVNQWWQEQGTLQNKDNVKYTISLIQAPNVYLAALREIKKNDYHYCKLSFLKGTPAENLGYFFNLIKQDCEEHFTKLKEKIKVGGNAEEFADKICSDIQRALHVYPEMENLLVSMVLKMGIFQLKD